MNGTVYASLAVRFRGITGIGQTSGRGTGQASVDAVIATVAVSSVVSALCSFVVVSNVYDALHGARAVPAAVVETAEAEATPPAAEPRRYPVAEAAPAALTRFTDALPARQTPVRPGDAGAILAALPDVSGPLVADSRDTAEVEPLLRAARSLSPEIALSLRTPLARPEGVTELAAVAPEVAAPQAAVNPLLLDVSPRPALRPSGLADRVPAAIATRAPAAAATIEVARAEAPDAALPPARLGDADRGRLFPPRAGANPCSNRLARAIPRRSGGAAGGSAIMARVGNGSGSSRDSAIVAEALSGNVPTHLRELQPVRFTGSVGGRQTEIVICVTPDYLAVGSDGDHVRVPLGLPAALRVADAFDMMLPTTRMVDAIYAQADLRVSPRPMPPGPQMSSTDYFMRHDATLDAQFAEAGARDGLLVAGHKKDLVLANRLSNNRGRVAIYGWHRGNGDPIQPLSTVHGEYYADYSHGIRLVSRTAYVDGRPVDLRGLLTDGTYAGLLNSEGPLTSATIRLASL
ncbi:hypothetical protein N8I71_11190 [Roseibacterium sp. SDUM158016]|uniref:hypothetical protein n=1 Tax=Roseicyclus sediminis TaxID=2980997 RepID=UPI0021D1A80A|nr:hypothetical protein [Roseibacterium sp. SDUM158016]MCU4653401.1 hypothetical protein [Roseibacterium sp. SDUM158016]